MQMQIERRLVMLLLVLPTTQTDSLLPHKPSAWKVKTISTISSVNHRYMGTRSHSDLGIDRRVSQTSQASKFYPSISRTM
ncbi:hypothetical protein BDQ17DRAFT_1080886 [Cyathus striatus]|nr:hypothetical protein BDQ17DRAFT_1080886 [Cyathus striatus]